MNVRMGKSESRLAASVGEDDHSGQTLRSCHQVMDHHARSFSLASRFLTEKVRNRAAITYAFCRLVDDAVDEAKSAVSAQAALDDIESMLRGQSKASPIVTAYLSLCSATGVGLAPAWDLILGARSDLRSVRMQSDADLLVYCYQVAGTVGLMMCGVLNVKEQQAYRFAIDLGIAMQLTNICRDVLEDAEMGRVYLPADRLVRHGVWSSELILAAKMPQTISLGMRRGVAVVVKELLKLADEYYASAKQGFLYIPVWPRLSIIFASRLYREIGEELRQREGDAMLGRVHVSRWRKFAVLAKSVAIWLAGVFRRPPELSLSKDASHSVHHTVSIALLSEDASHHATQPLFSVRRIYMDRAEPGNAGQGHSCGDRKPFEALPHEGFERAKVDTCH